MRVTVCKGTGGDLGVWTLGGGGVVSEFSVAWGKRGEGGQGREGVQLPDSLMDKAVLQSAGPRLEFKFRYRLWCVCVRSDIGYSVSEV